MPDILLYADSTMQLQAGGPSIKVGDQLRKLLCSVATGLTAHAGGGQTNALLLPAAFNVVNTVATAADSVMLPTAVAGLQVVVQNNAASNSMQVYGSGSDTINGVASGTGVAQAAGKAAEYYCMVSSAPGVAGVWFRNLSA